MKEHGIIANAFDYEDLDLRTLEDARLWMNADVMATRRQAESMNREQRRANQR